MKERFDVQFEANGEAPGEWPHAVVAVQGEGEALVLDPERVDVSTLEKRLEWVRRVARVKGLDRGQAEQQFEDAVRAARKRYEDDAPRRQAAEAAKAGPPAEEPDPEGPWPEPVDGGRLLDSLTDLFREYLVLPEWSSTALALWVLHTYLVDAAWFTPYLAVSSPTRICGKTTLLDLLEHVAFRPDKTDSITAAALFRTIERDRPALLLDEMDTKIKGDSAEELRCVLNSGFRRDGKVTRCVGDQHEPQDFATFCPKVIAYIGRLWDTVESRSIPIRLNRAPKAALKGLRKIRGDTIHAELQPLRRQLLRLAQDTRAALTQIDPAVPDALSARQADIWRPLLAIALAVGGYWPGV